MSFEILDIWIIVAIVGIAVIGFAVFKTRKKKESKASSKQFFTMGIIWILVGLGYSLWREMNPFDIGLFNLGLIFTIAGGIQLSIKRYKKRTIN